MSPYADEFDPSVHSIQETCHVRQACVGYPLTGPPRTFRPFYPILSSVQMLAVPDDSTAGSSYLIQYDQALARSIPNTGGTSKTESAGSVRSDGTLPTTGRTHFSINARNVAHCSSPPLPQNSIH